MFDGSGKRAWGLEVELGLMVTPTYSFADPIRSFTTVESFRPFLFLIHLFLFSVL